MEADTRRQPETRTPVYLEIPGQANTAEVEIRGGQAKIESRAEVETLIQAWTISPEEVEFRGQAGTSVHAVVDIQGQVETKTVAEAGIRYEYQNLSKRVSTYAYTVLSSQSL